MIPSPMISSQVAARTVFIRYVRKVQSEVPRDLASWELCNTRPRGDTRVFSEMATVQPVKGFPLIKLWEHIVEMNS